jgi:anhydro-N-acetylmuramic acid kinase
LIRSAKLKQPASIVNIGGVANVTYVDGETILAFDTGPGNAPIDDWAHRHAGKPIDEDGALAAKGKVDNEVLERMLQHDFFAKTGPKSLDRLDFGMADVEHLSPEDGAAT